MVEYRTAHLNYLFHALADDTRRQLLQCIAAHAHCTVTQLAKPFLMSLNAISKHLKVLERAGLIKRQKRGRAHYLVLNQQALDEASDVIHQLKQHWEARLDALEDHLKNTQSGD